MDRTKILTLILAGGAGGRLELLTAERAKPAMPFGGTYRLIDFPLSNAVHSGLSDVWVLQQYQAHTIGEHLANGRPWDLDRNRGGLMTIAPHTGTTGSGWHQGNADAIHRNRSLIREFDPDVILVLSADHVYQLDYRRVIEAHAATGAGVTIVTTEVPQQDAGRFGVLETDRDGRVTRFAYKPDEPFSGTVTTEVFVYTASVLLETLEQLAQEAAEDADGDDGGDQEQDGPSLQDFGHGLLPRLVDEGRAFGYPLGGYWRDLGTVESYWQGHMDLLRDRARDDAQEGLDLDDPAWPILTVGHQRMPALVAAGAAVTDSLVAPGCVIRGTVDHSVLAPGVVVQAGAQVRDSVVMRDTTIGPGSIVEGAIVDSNVEIGADVRLGARPDPSSPELVLVGRGARVADGTQVPAGGRVEGRPREAVTARHPI